MVFNAPALFDFTKTGKRIQFHKETVIFCQMSVIKQIILLLYKLVNVFLNSRLVKKTQLHLLIF